MKAKELAVHCARIADSKKAEKIQVLDVTETSSLTSYLVICSGRIDKHVRGIADEIMDKLKHQHMPCYHRDGEKDYRWVVLDFLDVIVHIFDPQTRDYYRLETMWGDAEEVEWQHASHEKRAGEKK